MTATTATACAMHCRGLAIPLAAALVMLVPSAAEAQGILPPIGARVRVTAPDLAMHAVTGTIVGATADTLSIAAAKRAPRLRIPVDKLSRLEVATGKNRVLGLARGAASGLVVGSLVGLGIAGLSRGEGANGIGSLVDVAILAGSAGTGLLIGGILGVAWAPDRWQDASLHPPANRGMGEAAATSRIGLRIAF